MRRRMLASLGKPLPYLRRVAYLETSGAQWINLSLKASSDLHVVMDIQNTNTNTNSKYVFGSTDSGWPGTKAFFMYWTHPFSYWNFYVKSSNFGGSGFPLSTERNIVDIWNGIFKVNGSTVKQYTNPVFSDGSEIILFNMGRNGTAVADGCLCKCWSFEIVGFRKLIPVLDLSGHPAMYDEVSGQFFYNQGTGEFTWGELET